MKTRYPFFVSLLISLAAIPVLAESSLNGTHWRIDAYKMADLGAWSDLEAKKIVGKPVKFESGSIITLGDRACDAHLKLVEKDKAKDLFEGVPPKGCGNGKRTDDVFSVELNCGDKIRFPPYVVRLSNRNLLAFGDGIELCLTPAN